MWDQKTWVWLIIGLLLGLFLIHPLLMLVAKAMSHQAAVTSVDQEIDSVLQTTFSFGMLPWALGLSGLTGLSAWLLAKMRISLIHEKKLQGAMELAGAACHQLSQPMQAILGYAEIISQEMAPKEPLRDDLEELICQITRMDTILRKIDRITKYETSEYLEGTQIIDIEKASMNDKHT